ncbi:hypothetical protein AVEN_27614-1 [Araneus ventricosus]|uniref:Uncharacterized protein n=1 Tax=Araneus ventricosus TaxID=182803 RepID=A0A4Y2EPZ1_ARAVE|nr:hypothetical protein AVEN_27614-1 [Araneus ventricosus]
MVPQYGLPAYIDNSIGGNKHRDRESEKEYTHVLLSNFQVSSSSSDSGSKLRGSHRHLDDETIRRNRPLKGFCQKPPPRSLLPYSQLAFSNLHPFIYVRVQSPSFSVLNGQVQQGDRVSGLFSTLLGFRGCVALLARIRGWCLDSRYI